MNKRIILLSFLLWMSSFAYAAVKMNAGILPYYYDKRGVAHFFIGQEHNGTWSDFGGRAEEEDLDALDTAAREFSEETRYVFGKKSLGVCNLKSGHDIKYKRASIRYIKSRITGSVMNQRKNYTMYLAQVHHIPAYNFTKARRVPHYEKKDYAWVPASRLIRKIKESEDRMRTYYDNKRIRKEFADIIKEHGHKIMRMIES